MYEKVNPAHPDKIADRIAGAIVDEAYRLDHDPKIAVEVLIGHGVCHIIVETSVSIDSDFVGDTVHRIAGTQISVVYVEVPQDSHLAANQDGQTRCGDNGIFRGCPVTQEQKNLTRLAHNIYDHYRSDGKYILNAKDRDLIICQSNAQSTELAWMVKDSGIDCTFPAVNPLGDWTGGTDVDTGATNRKLGSDMGDAVTGGGLHGKDLSKADVSVNIYAHLQAQKTGKPVEYYCAIGDDHIGGVPYAEVVRQAREYVEQIGGFEKLAEWGLIR